MSFVNIKNLSRGGISNYCNKINFSKHSFQFWNSHLKGREGRLLPNYSSLLNSKNIYLDARNKNEHNNKHRSYNWHTFYFQNSVFHKYDHLNKLSVVSYKQQLIETINENRWIKLCANFNSISKKEKHECGYAEESEKCDKLKTAQNDSDKKEERKNGTDNIRQVREFTERKKEREKNEVPHNYTPYDRKTIYKNDRVINKNKIFKGNYFKNVHSLLLTKKIKDALNKLKDKHSYKIIMKRIKQEKNKINSVLSIYQIKKGNFKNNFNEHVYRKAIIHTKTKIFQVLKKIKINHLWIYTMKKKKKYKLRKQKLLELQEKFIKNSKLAHINVKNFFKKYGYIGLGTYFVVFLVTFCCSYFFVHFKYISLADITYWSEKTHLKKYINDDLHKKIDSLWGELIFAYIASKVTEPVRIIITILITPYIAKIIRIKRSSRIKSH
ncbi:hypothetical protein, conserved [Plasmodium gonderi]|uniref:DUF1279 domain-containing protein n=1 Tax=Plasmodium gonderi TaxID=77519 RepID=A0A1Y1JKX1_PLAGO|nr:hypothetical protein, conserved [Plasmodium gonderi]GAW82278.1 hypothetical protein, conserved [Plasmodium gonderi]